MNTEPLIVDLSLARRQADVLRAALDELEARLRALIVTAEQVANGLEEVAQRHAEKIGQVNQKKRRWQWLRR